MKKILCLLFLPFCVHAQNLDIRWLTEINLHRNHQFDGSMTFISNSEYVVGVAAPLSVLLASWVKKDATLLEKGITISTSVLLNTGSTFILKRIIDRPRPGVTYPYLQPFEQERRFSFPSGHTSNAFCTATALSLNFKKWYVVVPAFLWAGTVGYSRMHLGMHYPSDVLGGALLGAGSAYATYKVNRWLKSKYIKKYKPVEGIQ